MRLGARGASEGVATSDRSSFWDTFVVSSWVRCSLAGAVATVALCGCQTTAQRSAELERHAKRQVLALRGVSVAKESPNIEVLRSSVVHSSEGTAVVVTLRNTSARTLEDAPIEITVRDARGNVLFRNDQPGLDRSLTTVSLLEARGETLWVDDQVQVRGVPASASARVGEAQQVSGNVPRMGVSEAHLTGTGGEASAAGAVRNPSRPVQADLVVYAVARKSGRIVAAGRAVLPEVGVGATVPFQVYFVGDPQGAQIQTSAPATTF